MSVYIQQANQQLNTGYRAYAEGVYNYLYGLSGNVTRQELIQALKVSGVSEEDAEYWASDLGLK